MLRMPAADLARSAAAKTALRSLASSRLGKMAKSPSATPLAISDTKASLVSMTQRPRRYTSQVPHRWT